MNKRTHDERRHEDRVGIDNPAGHLLLPIGQFLHGAHDLVLAGWEKKTLFVRMRLAVVGRGAFRHLVTFPDNIHTSDTQPIP